MPMDVDVHAHKCMGVSLCVCGVINLMRGEWGHKMRDVMSMSYSMGVYVCLMSC